jgi:hypothetical protein
MVNQRRVNRRGGRSRPKTDLDDLEGALTSKIGSHSEGKLTTDASDDRRFVFHGSDALNDANTRKGDFAASEDANDTWEAPTDHTSNFEKHQVNYSATKYIKP